MRLLLACLVLFLAPAGALLVTEKYVSTLEDEFLQDATAQVQRLNDVYQLSPPRVKKMRLAPAIMQLRGLNSGSDVANRVCGSLDSPFTRLFERLSPRCSEWTLLRKARWAALLSVAVSALMLGLVLMARITVERYATLEAWPGNWAMWFVMRGITLVLAAQVAVSLAGPGIVLQTVTGKTALTLAALTLPFLALTFGERKLVLAFVEPRRLNRFRPKHGMSTPTPEGPSIGVAAGAMPMASAVVKRRGLEPQAVEPEPGEPETVQPEAVQHQRPAPAPLPPPTPKVETAPETLPSGGRGVLRRRRRSE
jgi:hypothetical protein